MKQGERRNLNSVVEDGVGIEKKDNGEKIIILKKNPSDQSSYSEAI